MKLIRSTPVCAVILFASSFSLSHAEVLVIGSNGVEKYTHATHLVAFSPKPISTLSAKVSSRSALPSRAFPKATILKLINATSLKYAGHAALRKSGMSTQQWMGFFQANIEIESRYKVSARSPVGAIGLGQLMPATAKILGVDPHIPTENLDGSARYLLSMLDKFGTPALALAAYNAGPEAVSKYGGIPPYQETQGHVRKVLHVYNQITK